MESGFFLMIEGSISAIASCMRAQENESSVICRDGVPSQSLN